MTSRWDLGMVRAFLAVAAAGWVAVAAASGPVLPAPDGKYAVGVVRSEFVDAARRLDANDAGSGPRQLPAIVWYPAAERAAGDVAYMRSEEAAVTVPAIARIMGWDESELQSMKSTRVAAREAARPARGQQKFPVVIFSHGFFLYPEQNSALASRLASHGYIVVSIAHPRDAADLRLQDGRVIPTNIAKDGDDPRVAKAVQVLVEATDLSSVREALKGYGDALAATRFGRSLVSWRDDTLVVANAIIKGNAPRALRDVLVSADRDRLAFAGMSFGGATAATTCKLVAACRAAVNLDGQNFDPDLFDRPVGRPMLLMLSDWTRYNLFKGQRKDEDFSPNDLAYESWSKAGQDHDLVRVRLEGSRHMGFTDLVAMMEGSKREDRVGEVNGDVALSAIGDVVLAFLDARVRDGNVADIDRAIDRHPELKRHVPSRLKEWMGEADQKQ